MRINTQHLETDQIIATSRHQIIAGRSLTFRQLLVFFAFILLLLIGAGLRLVTYDRFLPFQDRTDESVYQVTSLHRRGVEPNEYVAIYYASQPPGYIWLTMLMQPFVEYGRPWTLLTDYLHMQKLIAVLIGVLTTAIVMRLGWLIGGTPAAWFAGLVWAFSTEIIDRNNQALPDPFVYLTVAASLVMVIQALRHESPRWLFGSLIMGIVAIYFKYTPWYIVIPWGIVALLLLFRSPRQVIPWLLAQTLVGAVCAWFLLVNYAALDLPNREVETFRDEGITMALDSWRIFNNLWSATRPIGETIFLVTLPLGILAYFYNRRHNGWLVDARWYAIFLIYAIIGILMISSFTNVWQGLAKYRHTLPVTIAFIGLWSAAVAQIIHALTRFRPGKPYLGLAAGISMALVFIVPNTFSNVQRFERFQRVVTDNLLWIWTDQNVPLEGRILTRSHDSLQNTWNRWWGGYDGKKPFEWWHEDDIPQNTPAEYAERGIMYFAITGQDLETGYDRADRDVPDFVNQLVHVKTISNEAADVIGPVIHFYRMIPPAIAVNVKFDSRIDLVGYDMSVERLHPGDTLTVRPYWQVTEVPRSNYSMFLHLAPRDEDEIIAQYDGPPAQPARPTLTWTDLDELFIGADAQLQLPPDLAPGDYRLLLGLYDYLTGERLRNSAGEDFYTINLTVEAN